MKTEMKMIAAILAVLAVALGGVYALDGVQADDASETQAIWPGPPSGEDHDHQYADWTKEAKWVTDENTGVVYWMDITSAGAWFTVLDGTQLEYDSLWESFRVKAEVSIDEQTKEIDWSNIQIEFYNFRDGYTLTSSSILPRQETPILNSAAVEVETEIGTMYLNGLEVIIQLNKTGVPNSVTVRTFIPVLVVEKIDVTEKYEYAYIYNGLWQSPIKDLNASGDNSKATPLQYAEVDGKKVPVYNDPDAVPYIHKNDCFDEYAEYGIAWKYSGDVKMVATNKALALDNVGAVGYDFENGYYYDADGNPVYPVIKEYTATLIPTGSQYITGKITINWWILPLGLKDVNFTIKDVKYDYDNEVKPTVENKDILMTWWEPEDGPNGAKAHYLGYGAQVNYYDVSYDVPSNFPAEYKVEVPVYDADGKPVYVQDTTNGKDATVQLRDQYGRLMFSKYLQKKDGQGNAVVDENNDPVYEKETVQDYMSVYVEVTSETVEGKTVYTPVKTGDKYDFYTIATVDGNKTLKPADVKVDGTPTVWAEDKLVETVDNKTYKPVYDGVNQISLPVTKWIIQAEDEFGRLVYTDLFEASENQITITEVEHVYMPVYDATAVKTTVETSEVPVYVEVNEEGIVSGAYYTITGDTEKIATAVTTVTVTNPDVKDGEPVEAVISGEMESKTFKPVYDVNPDPVKTTVETSEVPVYVEVNEEGIVSGTYYTIDESASPATATEATGVSVENAFVKSGDPSKTIVQTLTTPIDVYVQLDEQGNPIEGALYTIDNSVATEVDLTAKNTIIVKGDETVTLATLDGVDAEFKLAYELGDAKITVDGAIAYVEVVSKTVNGETVYTPVKGKDGKYQVYTIVDKTVNNIATKVATLVKDVEYTYITIDSDDEVVTIGEGDAAKSYMPAYAPAEVDVYIIDADGEIIKRHLLYANGQYAYYQLADENGKPVYDDKGRPVYDVPVYDEDGNLISEGNPILIAITATVPNYDEGSDKVYMYQVPVTADVDKYDQKSTAVTVKVPTVVPKTDAQDNPVYVQKEDEFGRLIYDDYLYEQLRFETGQINGGNDQDNLVWEQATNGDGTLRFNSDGTPEYDYDKPVYDYDTPKTEIIFVEVTGQGSNTPKDADGVYTYVLIENGAVVGLGTTKTAPRLMPVSDIPEVEITTGTGESATSKYYRAVAIVEKYDSDSGKVYLQKTETKIFTQVGLPGLGEFDYTVSIVFNSGFAEFNTDDYYAVDPTTGKLTYPDLDYEGNYVYAPMKDKDGNLVLDDKYLPIPSRDILASWSYVLVEQVVEIDGKEVVKEFLIQDGVKYDAN